MGLIGKSNEEKIWNYLKGKGISDYGCAGLMGNLFAESGLRPNNLQNTGNVRLGMTDDEYVKAVDSGSYVNFVHDSQGFGLAQWTFWSRKKSLYDYVKSKNASIGDLEAQLDFLYKELSERYISVLSVVKNATSILQASNSFLMNYERPADQSWDTQSKRVNYGKVYFDKFSGNSSIKIESDNATKEEEKVATNVSRTTLKMNSKGSDVSYLQTSLNKLGYNCGSVDGIFGIKTLTQVRRFQQSQKIEVDGVVGANTWTKLEIALDKESNKNNHSNNATSLNNAKVKLCTINKGDKGILVKSMQLLLIGNGYNCGGSGADGDFGSGTLSALKRFQTNKGISVDGICGKNTWNKLLKG